MKKFRPKLTSSFFSRAQSKASSGRSLDRVFFPRCVATLNMQTPGLQDAPMDHILGMAAFQKENDAGSRDASKRDSVKHFMGQILSVLPPEWRGTTFHNNNLLGREGFARQLEDLTLQKSMSGESISREDLVGIGYAEDYLRVASNISTMLELALAEEKGIDVSQVFTFASEVLPILSVCLATKRPVKLYLGKEKSPFATEHHEFFKSLGVTVQCFPSFRIQAPGADELILSLESAHIPTCEVDGIIAPNVLYIMNPQKIVPAEVLVIRKRMGTPVTTPVAEGMLQMLAGVKVTANFWGPSRPGVAKFHAHLQNLCGTPVDKSAVPVVSTVGLSVLSSLWMTLVNKGGADVLMCSTAYGGSCQLTEIFDKSEGKFRKHEFHIQGADANIVTSLQSELTKLANDSRNLLPRTVIFMEVPTNPDMKVPDMSALVAACDSYGKASGRKVVLLIDATFAPGSRILKKLKDLAPDLSAMVFISLSKSVSRGLTTAGAIVANHTQEAIELLRGVAGACEMTDTIAKPDQMMRLVEHHAKVEERCQQAYNVAVIIGDRLRRMVLQVTEEDMPLAFVTPEQAAMGFTSSTFSFNLPPLPGGTPDSNERLAQEFVDLLCKHSHFKPCVSFGQDNGLVYATVPATSTQGAVKAEDKAKQAVGGVQLVRLSFPPACDVDAISKIIEESLWSVYKDVRSS